MPGVLEPGSRGGSVRLANGLSLVVEPSGVADGVSVFCLVRPEAVRLLPPGTVGVNRFTARVTGVVFLGGRYDCDVTLAGDVTLRAEVLAGGGAPPPQAGDPTIVGIAPEDIIVLSE